MTEKPLIVFIVGEGRSGTTLLGRILGAAPGVFHVGEAARYFTRSEMRERNLPCACGDSVNECEFWSKTIQNVGDEINMNTSKYIRVRLFNKVAGQLEHNDGEIINVKNQLEKMYHDIFKRSGASIIVDTSKHPVLALVVSKILGFRIRIVHLVRDASAVVQSWSKQKGYLTAHSKFFTTLSWLITNIRCRQLKAYVDDYIYLDYIDFTQNPDVCIKKVLPELDEEWLSRFMRYRITGIHLGVQHSLAGNPDRSEKRIIIREQTRKCSIIKCTIDKMALAMLKKIY
jgi:hypothetical protein